MRDGRWLLVGLAALVGCGEAAGPATGAVTGTVTQKGSPVAGAVVSFVPAEAGGQGAVGSTDASGKYSLTTRKKDDGAIPGKYKVKITKFEGSTDVATGGAAAGPDGQMPASYTGAAPASNTPPKNLLPAKYADPESSGLSATVTAGPNTQNFDLEG